MKPFPGVGVFLDKLCGPDHGQVRARVLEDGLLGEMADLLGQAYRHDSEASAGIVEVAATRLEVLKLRAAVAEAMLAAARTELGLSRPTPTPTPTSARNTSPAPTQAPKRA